MNEGEEKRSREHGELSFEMAGSLDFQSGVFDNEGRLSHENEMTMITKGEDHETAIDHNSV